MGEEQKARHDRDLSGDHQRPDAKEEEQPG
jgi:hypothetical protein